MNLQVRLFLLDLATATDEGVYCMMASTALRFLFWVGAALLSLLGYVYLDSSLEGLSSEYPELFWWVPREIEAGTYWMAVAGLLFAYLIFFEVRHLISARRARWMDVDTAARFFRDRVAEGGEVSGVLDFFDGEDHKGYFLSYVRDGINRGIVIATGVPRNGMERRRLPHPVRDRVVEDNRESETITASDDRVYEALMFEKGSLRRYARELVGLPEG